MEPGIWRLPGPAGMLRDITQEVARGRHVVAVIPRWLADDADFTDGMSDALAESLGLLGESRRIYLDSVGFAAELSDALPAAVADEFGVNDPVPVTASELVWHPDLSRSIGLIVAANADERLRSSFPGYLPRLAAASRSGPAQRGVSAARFRLVVVATVDSLPILAGARELDVALATVWWWNRVARWDIASRVASIEAPVAASRVVMDIRTETIVELARWQLDLADRLAHDWSGDPDTLHSHLGTHEGADQVLNRRRPTAAVTSHRPDDDHLDEWDKGRIDGWHDHPSPYAGWLLSSPDRLKRRVWAAQARILLPWIEQQREGLHVWALKRVGAKRFRTALEASSDSPPADGEVVEVGPLKRAIWDCFGRGEPEALAVANKLLAARNKLAHLTPMGLSAITELVATCEAFSRDFAG